MLRAFYHPLFFFYSLFFISSSPFLLPLTQHHLPFAFSPFPSFVPTALPIFSFLSLLFHTRLLSSWLPRLPLVSWAPSCPLTLVLLSLMPGPCLFSALLEGIPGGAPSFPAMLVASHKGSTTRTNIFYSGMELQ